jgi:hypothetical protein
MEVGSEGGVEVSGEGEAEVRGSGRDRGGWAWGRGGSC